MITNKHILLFHDPRGDVFESCTLLLYEETVHTIKDSATLTNITSVTYLLFLRFLTHTSVSGRSPHQGHFYVRRPHTHDLVY